MRFEVLFPSKYLAAIDVIKMPNRELTATIKRIYQDDLETKKGKEKKVLIDLAGLDKPLVCNKTNGKTIAKLWGSEVDDWIGKPITLIAMWVEAYGETVEAIRVKPEKPGNGAQNFNDKVTAALDAIAPQPVAAS